MALKSIKPTEKNMPNKRKPTISARITIKIVQKFFISSPPVLLLCKWNNFIIVTMYFAILIQIPF